MDDLIDSVKTEDKSIELYRELVSLWSLADMQARKWISNSAKVIFATPERSCFQAKSMPQERLCGENSWLFLGKQEDTLTIVAVDVLANFPFDQANRDKMITTVFNPLELD